MKDENLMKSRAALHASAAMSHSPSQVGFVDNTFFLIFLPVSLSQYIFYKLTVWAMTSPVLGSVKYFMTV